MRCRYTVKLNNRKMSGHDSFCYIPTVGIAIALFDTVKSIKIIAKVCCYAKEKFGLTSYGVPFC